MICDECETVAHCMKNGCVPKQNSVDRLLDEAKLLADDRPVEVEGLPEWAIDAEHTIRRLVKALTSVPDWASEAIEQPSGVSTIAPVQQEPVAYAVYHRMGGGKSLHWPEQHSPDGDESEYRLVPLYPPTLSLAPAPEERKRQARSADTWVGLNDTDLAVCGDQDDVLLARYWERVCREKNT